MKRPRLVRAVLGSALLATLTIAAHHALAAALASAGLIERMLSPTPDALLALAAALLLYGARLGMLVVAPTIALTWLLDAVFEGGRRSAVREPST